MVKEHAIAGVHAITLAVINGDPVAVQLGDGVGTTGVEGRGFLLGNLLNQAVQLAGAGLINLGFLREAQHSNRLKNPQRAQRVTVSGVFGSLKTHRHVALSAEVIDLVRLDLLNDADQVGAGSVHEDGFVRDAVSLHKEVRETVKDLLKFNDQWGGDTTETTINQTINVLKVELAKESPDSWKRIKAQLLENTGGETFEADLH